MVACASCQQQTSRGSSKSIQCSACLRVFHLSIKCGNINNEDYQHLVKEQKLNTWKCTQCTNTHREITQIMPQVDETSPSWLTKSQIEDLMTQFVERIEKKLDEKLDILSNRLSNQVAALATDNEVLKEENKKLVTKIDTLEHYTRRDNLILRGIIETKNENTNDIVLTVAKQLGICLELNDISTSHRLPSSRTDLPRLIMVKFVRRDVRNTFFNIFKKKARNDVSGPGVSATIISPSLGRGRISCQEHITTETSKWLAQVKDATTKAEHKFIWVKDGKVYVKKGENSTNKIVPLGTDLKLFFSKKE